MITEKNREDFEIWHAAQVSRLIDHGEPTAARVWTDFKGMHWNIWQASRESLVIELPDDGIEDCRKEWPERGEKYGYDTFDTGYLYACKKHEEAIKATGVKVAT